MFSKINRSVKRSQKIIDVIKLPNTGKLLDLSCGDGKFLSLIQDLKPKLNLYGFDMSKQNLSPNINFTQGSSHNLPYQKESFDIIICSMSLHHYNNVVKTLAEIDKVLKVGGKLFLTDIFPKNILSQKVYNTVKCHEPYHFEKFYTINEIIFLTHTLNLKVLNIYSLSKIPRIATIEMQKL